MSTILVYLPNGKVPEGQTHFGARFPDADLQFRNVHRHEEGQLEDASLVLVDDRYPTVGEEYRESEREVEVEYFDVGELGEEPVPQDEPFRDLFASTKAADLAEGELSREDLEGVEPAGKTGYTTAQVRELVGS